MILTEITWDKLLTLRDRFGYDGKTLGAAIGPDYDAARHPVWFPDKVGLTLARRTASTRSARSRSRMPARRCAAPG